MVGIRIGRMPLSIRTAYINRHNILSEEDIMLALLSIISLFCLTGGTTVPTTGEVAVTRMVGFPSAEQGIEQGVSACFAGCIGHTLVMAGGCNFPDIPAAEGGTKKYYQGIYAAVPNGTDTLQWHQIGMLPQAVAYGVSAQRGDTLICMGGNNLHGSQNAVLAITLQDGKAVVDSLPSLPHPMDNFAGCICGNRLMAYNGESLMALDLQHLKRGWQALPLAQQEKLNQPVCASMNGNLITWGGSTIKTEGKPCTLRIDGRAVADNTPIDAPTDALGNKLFLGGAAAINLNDSTIVVMGGVNRDIYLAAVNHPQADYMHHQASWYRFNPYVHIYNNVGWHTLYRNQCIARAGATLARHGRTIYMIGGERKPGIRAAEVWRLTFR